MDAAQAQARTDNKPIGYWLKALDQLIENSFEPTLADEALTRRHWQVLNSVAERASSTAELDHVLAAFADGPAVDAVIAELHRRDWLAAAADGSWSMTPDGQAAHARIAARVQAIRRRSAAGVSRPDYETAVTVLERMCRNLSG